mgnify:CR=1 FL=1
MRASRSIDEVGVGRGVEDLEEQLQNVPRAGVGIGLIVAGVPGRVVETRYDGIDVFAEFLIARETPLG